MRRNPFVQRRHPDAKIIRHLLACKSTSSAIRTASLRNSSVRFSPMVRLLCCNKCYQRGGIKPRQVHALLGGVGSAIAIFKARIAKSRFILMLAVQPMTRRECRT